MHRSLFIAGLVLAQAFAPPGQAAEAPQPPAAVSIADALQQAWRHAPAAAALPYREAELEARLHATQRLTPGAPTVGLGHRGDRLTGHEGQQEWELEVTTPLWLPGQREARHKLARAQRSALSAQSTLQRLELAGQVREAWWQLALAGDAVAVAARRLQSARELQSDVERRWRAGDLARVDANGAQAEAQAAEAEWVDAQGEQRHALAAWHALNGGAPPDHFADEGLAAGPENLDDHPRQVAAVAAVATARTQLRLAERSDRDAPELALRWVSERGARAEPYARSLGLQLRIPLSSGPDRAADRAGLSAELAQAETELERLRDQLAVELRHARRNLDAVDRSLALARSRAALAADSLVLLQKSFSLGETGLPALLRTRAEAHDAEARLARQTRARSAAISRLNQALGVLP